MQPSNPEILERHNKPSSSMSEKRSVQRVPEPDQHFHLAVRDQTARQQEQVAQFQQDLLHHLRGVSRDYLKGG